MLGLLPGGIGAPFPSCLGCDDDDADAVGIDLCWATS